LVLQFGNLNKRMEFIIEFLLNSLGFFASDNSVDVTSDKIEADEIKLLATSPSSNEKDEEPKKPTGDSEICKKLTDRIVKCL
jgi:hypothetical protein